VLAFVVGVTDALSMPSYQSIVPSIVEADRIPAGLALSSIQFNLSRILGPALAGALLAGAGLVACFAVNVASYIPFIAVAVWILPRSRDGSSFDVRHPFAGARATLADRRLRGALSTVLATGFLCGPLVTFLPVLVRTALGGGTTAFSTTITSFGIGGLIGAGVVLSIDPTRDHRRRCSLLAIGLGGIVLLAAVAPWLWTLPILGGCAGAAMTTSNTLANTMIQQTAGAELRGQAVSLYMLAMRGGVALGSLVTGASVYLLGVRTALVVDGVLAVAIQTAIGYAWRRDAGR
jgi:predicted MFS family arabinose efflux permease